MCLNGNGWREGVSPVSGLRDAVEDAGLRAVEFLVPLAVFFRELNHEFEVRAMKTCVSLDLPVADREDPLQVRYFVRAEKNISAP